MQSLFRAELASFALAICSVAFAQGRDSDDFNFGQGGNSPPEVMDARSKADAAYQRGDYAKVIELSTWLIDNHPDDNIQVAYHLRASAKIEQGRQTASAKLVRDGIADARAAIGKAGTEYPWLYIPYSYGLSSLAEIECRKEHAEMAIKTITPILQTPESKNFTVEDRANLYYQRGFAQAARGDFKAAVDDHDEAIKLSPQHLGSLVKRAEALNAQGKGKESLEAYDTAVERFPNNLVVANDRGKLRRVLGDLDGAVEDFTRCLEIDPKFAVGMINRGMCLSESNNPQAAESDFTDALAMKLDAGTTALAYRMRGGTRVAQGNATDAIADYDAAIKLSPRDPALFEERGTAKFFQKNYEAAAADLAKVEEINPQVLHVIPWRALALEKSEKLADAKALLEATLAGKPAPNAWTAKVCAFLLDQTTEQELLDAAAAPTGAKEKARLQCEARYFIGQKALLNKQADKGADSFREAVATKQFSLSAYRGARFALGEFDR